MAASIVTKTEKLSISEACKVVGYVTVFKNSKWWEAVVAYEAYGKRSIGLYLWMKLDYVWKRKSKFSLENLDEWNKVKKLLISCCLISPMSSTLK